MIKTFLSARSRQRTSAGKKRKDKKHRHTLTASFIFLENKKKLTIRFLSKKSISDSAIFKGFVYNLTVFILKQSSSS